MTSHPKLKVRWAALAIVAVSFVVSILSVVVVVGISNTPYETMDRAGNKMGFNDALSAEHYRIILSHFRIQNLFALGYTYSWLLWGMHGLGAWLLLPNASIGRPLIRWYFGLQGVIFPVGWLGFLALPMMVRSVLNGTLDREGIIDVPFIAITAEPIWIGTALMIFAMSWRTSLQAPNLQNNSANCPIAAGHPK